MPAAPRPRTDGGVGAAAARRGRGRGLGFPGEGPERSGRRRSAPGASGLQRERGRTPTHPSARGGRGECGSAETAGRGRRGRRLEPAFPSPPPLKFAVGPTAAPGAPGHPARCVDGALPLNRGGGSSAAAARTLRFPRPAGGRGRRDGGHTGSWGLFRAPDRPGAPERAFASRRPFCPLQRAPVPGAAARATISSPPALSSERPAPPPPRPSSTSLANKSWNLHG